MLADKEASPTIAVRNLDVAKGFYERTLGLKPIDGEDSDQAVVYRTGDTKLLVYKSDFAGTNKATAVTWMVGDDLDGIVRTLKEKGVRFEHYQLPQLHRVGDVHVGGDMKIAWFKDPDGNILGIVNQ